MTSSESGEESPPPSDNDEPILAKLVNQGSPEGLPPDRTEPSTVADQAADVGQRTDELGDQPDTDIRVGSPFAVDPTPIAGTAMRRAQIKPEAFYDVGPLRYTALGAVGAAVLVLGFAVAAAWWFPGGGTVIAALGCALSIFGLYSPRRYTAGGCLAAHLFLFMLSYSRAIAA